ncbi:MAG: hypothetical protein WCH35_11580 [Comamonadaceae bacterium]
MPGSSVPLTDLARHANVMNPVGTTVAPLAQDTGDQFLWDLLAAHADLLLVTGEKLLQQDAAMQLRVISPQAFIAQRSDQFELQ